MASIFQTQLHRQRRAISYNNASKFIVMCTKTCCSSVSEVVLAWRSQETDQTIIKQRITSQFKPTIEMRIINQIINQFYTSHPTPEILCR